MFEREGEGWRLAWDPQRHPFPLLIGGDGWASELTAAEGQALFRAVSLLHSQHRQLVDTLMEEEAINLDFTGTIPAPINGEEGDLWAALEGDRHTWSLCFVLQPTKGLRGLEGSWARGAAAELARACTALLEGGRLDLGS